jgi:hypothetical protein
MLFRNIFSLKFRLTLKPAVKWGAKEVYRGRRVGQACAGVTGNVGPAKPQLCEPVATLYLCNRNLHWVRNTGLHIRLGF